MKLLITIFISQFLALTALSQYPIQDWDSITFEVNYPHLVIDTSQQNLWQIAEPQKVFFDSAFSTNKAILTDSINNYPVNNLSYFDIYLGSHNMNWLYGNIFLEIQHKFDSDSLRDGGFISISPDMGQTWINIAEDTISGFDETPKQNNYGQNLYSINDTLYNGELGFSGNSGDWITTQFGWINFPIKKLSMDSLIIRFNFLSDSIETNQEGWMIDHIKIYSIQLPGNVQGFENLQFELFPNPVSSISRIVTEPYSEALLQIFDMNGRLVLNQAHSNNNQLIINKDDLKSGLYMVNLLLDQDKGGAQLIVVK